MKVNKLQAETEMITEMAHQREEQMKLLKGHKEND